MLMPARTGEAVGPRSIAVPRAWTRSAPAWALLALIVAGAAVRFATLTSQSYWFDEAQAAHELHLSFGAMLSSWNANEPNPPLFFVIGWLWAQLFGTGEAGIRSLSALAGTAVIPIAYLCARELVGRGAGLVVAMLVAVNAFMIWYSQEAREYMLLAALCGGSLLLFARQWREPSRRNLLWWTACSALALLTQYFAVFLVGAEAIALLWRYRVRAMAGAVAVLCAVEGALLPHAIAHASHPTGWIDAFPLSIRIEQVPVAFGLGTLYQSSLVSYGLIGGAILAGVVIVLLLIGADAAQLRGAGIAAALAGFVLLVPLLLAVLGHDYYEARALMPAWIPLAVAIGAACTAPRTRLFGGMLSIVLLAGFLYADVRVSANASYRRPNWRGVARAIGTATAPRAIVAYDGVFATAPLAVYLPGVAWTASGQIPQTSRAPVTVDELDVVGSVWQQPPSRLPSGARLIASRPVDGYLVDRFALAAAWRMTPAQIGARAAALLSPAPARPGVLIQLPAAATRR